MEGVIEKKQSEKIMNMTKKIRMIIISAKIIHRLMYLLVLCAGSLLLFSFVYWFFLFSLFWEECLFYFSVQYKNIKR